MIDDYEAYWGCINREHLEKKLQKPGDFMFRYGREKSGQPVVLVTLLTKNAGMAHRALKFDYKKGWSLEKGAVHFQKTPELIRHYRINPLPGVNDEVNRLLYPVVRPAWVLNRTFLLSDKKELGSGNFCTVTIGTYLKHPVAIKTCHQEVALGETVEGVEGVKKVKGQNSARIEFSSSDIPTAQFALVEEGEIMSALRHPNIIHFVGLCVDCPPVKLVMELCEGGSLLEHLKEMGTEKRTISNGEFLMYTRQIADGMEYLQGKNMIHRDLAARNILLDKAGTLKISDFGLTKIAATIYGEDISRSQIPLRGMAPECLKKEAAFSTKSDVWSFGMLVFELFSYGEGPAEWETWPVKKIATRIRKAQMPAPPSAEMPSEMQELVKICWQLDPSARPDFHDLATLVVAMQEKYPPPSSVETTLSKYKHLDPTSAVDAGKEFDTIADQVARVINIRRAEFDREGPVLVKIKSPEEQLAAFPNNLRELMANESKPAVQPTQQKRSDPKRFDPSDKAGGSGLAKQSKDSRARAGGGQSSDEDDVSKKRDTPRKPEKQAKAAAPKDAGETRAKGGKAATARGKCIAEPQRKKDDRPKASKEERSKPTTSTK